MNWSLQSGILSIRPPIEGLQAKMKLYGINFTHKWQITHCTTVILLINDELRIV
jgi:hypothetical protein